MGADAVEHGGVVACEEGSDLSQAEVVSGSMTEGPPDFMPGEGDGSRATTPAQVAQGHAAAAADLLGDGKQIASPE